MELECKSHGTTRHRMSSQGKKRGRKYECIACIKERQTRVRHRKKQTLLDSLGGQCVLCGYKKWVFAIDFHHMDPTQKEFELGRGNYRSIEKCLAEAKKCVPLCRNCHAEVETGCQETIDRLNLWCTSPMVV